MNYVYYQFVWTILVYQKPIMDRIFGILTALQYEKGIQVQWLMSFVIPAFRRLVEWILPKFFNKAVGYKPGWTIDQENEPATFCMETMINLVYTIYVAVRLSSSDTFTGACILGVEFLINLYYCFQIIRMHRKIGGSDDNEHSAEWKAEKKSAMVSLLTVELIEILTPVAYAISLLMAYHGPNATLMTGIKNEYFGIPAITDIQGVLNVLFLMAGVDLLGGLIFGLLLGYFCKINIFVEICKILQKYWIHLAIFVGGDLTQVS